MLTPPLSLTLVCCGSWPSGSGFYTPLRVCMASVDAHVWTFLSSLKNEIAGGKWDSSYS